LVHVPGVTTVATLYDLIPLHQVRGSFSLRRVDDHLGYARYLRLLQRVDRILAISEATKRDAIERLRIPAERITAIPLAVDERRFYARSSEEIERVLTRHAVRRPYFLHVGSSDPHKNTDNILRAFSLFCHKRSEHILYIAGKWPVQALKPLQASYSDLFEDGRLKMLDFVPDDDLPALYSGAEALIYPSVLEGFGLPVLEAMRCGTPVLTSSTSSLPEVAGDAALLVNPHDIEEIMVGMQRLADDSTLRADLVARGLRQAAQFTFRRTAEETLRVYHELL
jgi:glycosyltransferase involved in cell wall biosynthesis